MGIHNHKTAINENNCINCGNHFEGSYCNKCGQKVINARYTLKHFFNIVFDSIDINRGVLYTAKLLTRNPGKVINDYLKGKTKDYYNPLSYLLIIFGIYAIIMIWFNVIDTSIENSNELLGLEEKNTRFQSIVVVYMKRILSFMPVFILPFYSLISKWVFRKQKLYYAEHLIINCYLFAQYSLLLTLLVVVLIPFSELNRFVMLFGTVVFIAYYTYALRGVFKISFSSSLFRTLGIFVFGTLLFYIFLIVVMIVVIILLELSGISLKELIQQ